MFYAYGNLTLTHSQHAIMIIQILWFKNYKELTTPMSKQAANVRILGNYYLVGAFINISEKLLRKIYYQKADFVQMVDNFNPLLRNVVK